MVSVMKPLLGNAKTFGTAPLWFPGPEARELWEMESVFLAFALMVRHAGWWRP